MFYGSKNVSYTIPGQTKETRLTDGCKCRTHQMCPGLLLLKLGRVVRAVVAALLCIMQEVLPQGLLKGQVEVAGGGKDSGIVLYSGVK